MVDGSGAAYYMNMGGGQGYAARINTPAQNPVYFAEFHQPLLDHARSRVDTGQHIRVLDIACGPGFELDFVSELPDVDVIASDISPDILPEVALLLGGTSLVFAADASNFALRPNVADAGFIVNAMVYVPDDMLGAMFAALKPGARCAVNFRSFLNQHNDAFYNHYTERGGVITNGVLNLAEDLALEPLPTRNLDYRLCVDDNDEPDEVIRPLGTQTYLGSVNDMTTLVQAVGFDVIDQQTFNFASPVNPDNQVNVFTLEKPVG